MEYLIIENKGLLEMSGLMLMGGTSKRNRDDMIGLYGSGLKYAVAVLLRHNIDFDLVIDGNQVQIAVKPVMLKDETLGVIHYNGQSANYTTLLGPDWELWMAIREIYCNAIDEGVFNIRKGVYEEDFDYQKDYTYFTIPLTPAIEDIIDNWEHYFSFYRSPLFESKEGRVKVYPKLLTTKSIIYRKGIKVGESNMPGCYDYDFEELPINELRVVKDFSYVENALREALTRSFDNSILKTILESKGTWEKEINLYSWDTIQNKSAWVDTLQDKMIIPSEFAGHFNEVQKKNAIILPLKYCESISHSLPEYLIAGYDKSGIVLPIELSDKQVKMLEYVEVELTKIGYSIDEDMDITFSNFQSPYILSKTVKGVIHLSHTIDDPNKALFEAFKQVFVNAHKLKWLSHDLENYCLLTIFNSLQVIKSNG